MVWLTNKEPLTLSKITNNHCGDMIDKFEKAYTTTSLILVGQFAEIPGQS